MIRASTIVLGVGLVILWVVGMLSGATGWLTWLMAVAALAAFGISAALEPRVVGAVVAAPIVLGVGMFGLWVIGLLTHASRWLTWWTLAAACAALAIGLAGGYVSPPSPTRLSRA